jgi:transcriptional regulator with XRE-family HTH domain
MGEQSPNDQSFFDPGGFKPISVGQRLRELRIERGFSIKALAEESGLAVNTLSLIENQKSSPSVNTLEQLAQALSVPITTFFEPMSIERHIIQTTKGHRRTMDVDGIFVEDCGLDLENQPMQPFIVTMPGGKDSGKQAVVHTGHEFIYCLSGKLDYFIRDEKYSLKEGDSLLFEARLPHRWVNPNQISAKYLLIMIPGEIEDTPGEVHFHRREETA